MLRSSCKALPIGLLVITLCGVACGESPLEPSSPAVPGDVALAPVSAVSSSGDEVAAEVVQRVVGSGHRVVIAVPRSATFNIYRRADGTVVSSVDPDKIGRPCSLHFVDNGEGANAPPDEIGVGRFVESDRASEPDLALHPLLIGDLRVIEWEIRPHRSLRTDPGDLPDTGEGPSWTPSSWWRPARGALPSFRRTPPACGIGRVRSATARRGGAVARWREAAGRRG